MRKLLSIVIPSYNSEKFMKTVLGNLIKVKNLDLLDIIVVDDGSVDNTFKESKFFSDHYSDSIKTISKENGGHGSAINTGIANAVGKYFKVLDADDWMEPRNLDRFLEKIKSEETDLIFTPFWTYDERTEKRRLKKIITPDMISNKSYDINSGDLKKLPTIHCLTVKTSILKNNNIIIDEHAFYVDVEFILYPIVYASTFKYIDIPLYVYKIDQQNQSISLDSMKKNVEQHERVIHHINKYIKKNYSQLSLEKKNIMIDRLSVMIAAQMKILSLFPINKQTKDDLRTFYKRVKSDMYFNIDAINLPIRMLIKSDFNLLPLIHMLAVLKIKTVHI